MKNLVNAMKITAQKMKAAGRRAMAKFLAMKGTAQMKLAENNGQFVMDNAVVFVIILVLGGAGLVLLRNFLNSDLAPTLRTKIMDFFN